MVSFKQMVKRKILHNLWDPNLTECKKTKKNHTNKHIKALSQLQRDGERHTSHPGHSDNSCLIYFSTISFKNWNFYIPVQVRSFPQLTLVFLLTPLFIWTIKIQLKYTSRTRSYSYLLENSLSSVFHHIWKPSNPLAAVFSSHRVAGVHKKQQAAPTYREAQLNTRHNDRPLPCLKSPLLWSATSLRAEPASQHLCLLKIFMHCFLVQLPK